MAHKMLLRGSKLPYIWNVSQRVGYTRDSVNQKTDVELVNFFLDFTRNIVSAGNLSKVIRDALNNRSEFDGNSGFWVFYVQKARQKNVSPSCAIDGKTSPATRYDPITFTIAYLNEVLFDYNRSLF